MKRMGQLERRLLDILERVDGEKISITFDFDKASWWQRRRAFPMFAWRAVIEWEDKTETFHASGYSGLGGSLDQAFNDMEATLNGVLLRNTVTPPP